MLRYFSTCLERPRSTQVHEQRAHKSRKCGHVGGGKYNPAYCPVRKGVPYNCNIAQSKWQEAREESIRDAGGVGLRLH